MIAIIKDDKVTNIVEGDLEVVAKLFDKVHPVTEISGPAWIGARFNGEKFEPKQPFSSWVWDEETFSYKAPKPKPEGAYRWDEETDDWVELPPPYESWTYNEEFGAYFPPKPQPDGHLGWDEEKQEWVSE